MVMPRIDVNEDALIQARRLYETTKVPVPDIADMLGISERTLHKRRAEWGWSRRRDRAADLRRRLALAAASAPPSAEPPLPPVPKDDVPVSGAPDTGTPEAAAPDGQPASAAAPKRPNLVKCIRQTIEREIAAVELHLRQVSPGAPRSHAGERAARTLATLVRTLNELKRLEREDSDAHDEAPRDIDALREALAEKLEQLKREVKGTAPRQPQPRRHRSPR